MGQSLRAFPLFILVLAIAAPLHAADEDTDRETAMMKAMAANNGRMSPNEQNLYKNSIKTAKQSVARETLDVFYRDALDYYKQGKYEEALEVLDNIFSVDPYYEDAGTLRETIRRIKNSHDIQSKRGILDDYMRKGNAAQAAGQNITAIGFWKQALQVNASYEPAKRKIRKANHEMAQKQYEAGYLHYHHGDMEEALDSWSNAIALDPSFKQRGLLQLMSKVELTLHKDKITQLAALGAQQYAQKDLPAALQTYDDLVKLDPRNEEARRTSAKIRIQLGQAAYKAGRDAVSSGMYAEAIKRYQDAIKYNYEVQKAQRGIQDAEEKIQSNREERIASRASKQAASQHESAGASTSTVTSAAAPTPPPVETHPEEALEHYREGLSAIRGKDFHRALEELDIAAKLDPTDERIYVARERAKQEWAAMNAGKSTQ